MVRANEIITTAAEQMKSTIMELIVELGPENFPTMRFAVPYDKLMSQSETGKRLDKRDLDEGFIYERPGIVVDGSGPVHWEPQELSLLVDDRRAVLTLDGMGRHRAVLGVSPESRRGWPASDIVLFLDPEPSSAERSPEQVTTRSRLYSGNNLLWLDHGGRAIEILERLLQRKPAKPR